MGFRSFEINLQTMEMIGKEKVVMANFYTEYFLKHYDINKYFTDGPQVPPLLLWRF